jgi:hypothetical protein
LPEQIWRVVEVGLRGGTMLEYHAAYYEIEDGWYLAKILDFPGAIRPGAHVEIGSINDS